jgi:hypothetical protein
MHKSSRSVLSWPDFLNNTDVLHKSYLKVMASVAPVSFIMIEALSCYSALLFSQSLSSTLHLRLRSVTFFFISKDIHKFVFLKSFVIFVVSV